MNFTEQQLKNFAAYVKVQKSNRFNMFDPRARGMTTMSSDEWVFNMKHYDALAKREEFLRDIAITAVEGGIGYWSSCKRYKWSETNSLDYMLPFPIIRIVPAEDPSDFEECDITAETIIKGLEKMNDPSFSINSNDRGTILSSNVECDASSIDADTADSIVQAGLFGELRFG